MIAALPLGFWVGLIGKGHNYETRLWRPALRLAFPHYVGSPKALPRELDDLRLFRNAIAHVRPIYHRPLVADHDRLLRVTGYLSRVMVTYIQVHDRVRQVLARRAAVCDGDLTPSF